MTVETLTVLAGKTEVGTLLYEDYHYTFHYHGDKALDAARDLVSLTMPVRARPYDTQVLPPPFQASLPEGELLNRLQMRFGKALRLTDDFSLLRLVGCNTVGRVTFHDPSVPDPDLPAGDRFARDVVLRHPDAAELFAELVEAYGFRFGVGGIQPKALLGIGALQAAVPTDQLLIKLAGTDFPHLPVNEHFCLRASRAAGLPTVASELADSRELLAIDRFDRKPAGEPLAFEEMCGLLQKSREGKYDGGYEQVARVVAQIPCQNTPAALRDLFGMVVLSMTLRNGDAHLKNFGVLYDSTDGVRLAPAYDLVTTTVYIARDQPALSFGDRRVWPDRATLEAFGLNACNLRRTVVQRTIEQVMDAVSSTSRELLRFGRAEPAYRELCARMASAWDAGLCSLAAA